MKKIKVTPENITKLKGNEVFVFGSNLSGVHGAGAAKLAQDKFGAITGHGIGLNGKSYALPTKDKNIQTMPISDIAIHVNELREYATTWKSLHFMITAVGCGLAGYEPKDIAPLFKDFTDLDNVSLPQSFLDILSVEETIPGFKGFGKDLKCRDFQYEFNKNYEIEGDVKACNHGFHFCEHPLNVFEYYPPAESRFASVVGSGKVSREEGGDTKVAVSKIHIGAEISLESLTKAAVKFVFDRAKWSEGVVASKDNEGVAASGYQGAATASGNRGAATASGEQGAATASGYQGAATASGYQGAATASGYQGAATASGYQGAATASGNRGAATASGYQGAATASGEQGAATASGYQGAATASGNRGAATASGEQGAAVSLGIDAKAKGNIGCWITLSEWKYDGQWNRIDVQTKKVDGEIIKADTFYSLVGGEFIQA